MNNLEDTKSLQQGHRERLRQKFLAGQMAEYEMLELLLTYAIPRRDVRTLSRQLYKKYGNLHRLLSAPSDSLMQNKGIKENTVIFLKIIYRLMALEYKNVLDSEPIFHDYSRVENYCRLILCGKPIEEFHILYLDVKYKLLEDELHSTGTTDWAAVYVREIIKHALNLNAKHVVLVHNHPTPNLCFSSQDIEITQELESTLSVVGINLYDHLLVSGDVVYSARNMNLLDKNYIKNKQN